ncbi:MAG: phosphoribosylformylglycinamidine synthase subunit PurQ [Pseudomonadota bacterium]
MKAGVIVFPGSNSDRDVAVAIERVCGRRPQMIWHGDHDLPDLDLVILPGGFAYGDYLRAGAMAARSPIVDAVKKHAARGGLTLGICNGFQMLTEMGLLPGALLRNRDLHFICRDVDLRVENTNSAFTRDFAANPQVRINMSHHDGNYVASDSDIAALEAENRVVFRYVDRDGTPQYDTAPNGSTRGIAGILNRGGNVLGLMPHPERLFENALGGSGGRPMFTSLMNHFAHA